MLVNITIPCFNEERKLIRTVDTLYAFLQRDLGFDWVIDIVDNGSTDGTFRDAMRLASNYKKVRPIRLDEKGRGRALKTAWSGGADIYCYMDVDLSTDVNALLVLIGALTAGHYDLATGSRLLPRSKVRRSLKREILSRGYNQIVRSMFDTRLTDFQCGFKAITARAAKVLLPTVVDDGWFFDTELLLRAEHFNYWILDLPVDWTENGDSRVKIVSTAYDDIKGLLRVRKELNRRDRERREWKAR